MRFANFGAKHPLYLMCKGHTQNTWIASTLIKENIPVASGNRVVAKSVLPDQDPSHKHHKRIKLVTKRSDLYKYMSNKTNNVLYRINIPLLKPEACFLFLLGQLYKHCAHCTECNTV